MKVIVRRHLRRKPGQFGDLRSSVRQAGVPEITFPMTLSSKTDNGTPLRVEVSSTGIFAYRTDQAQILSTGYEYDEEGKVKKAHIQVEEELSMAMSREPVMSIIWVGPGRYVVDFDAGFQRGRTTVGIDELCKRSYFPQPGKAYLKWIGLSCTNPVIRRWLEAHKELEEDRTAEAGRS